MDGVRGVMFEGVREGVAGKERVALSLIEAEVERRGTME